MQCEFLTVALPLEHVIALTGAHLCRSCASVRAIRMRLPLLCNMDERCACEENGNITMESSKTKRSCIPDVISKPKTQEEF